MLYGGAAPGGASRRAGTPARTRSAGTGQRPPVRIRRIRDRDLPRFRALRLRSLAHDPMAFGSTHARELAFPADVWTQRVHRAAVASDQSIWLAETPNRQLAGMVGMFPHEGSLHVFGMWVDPRFRGHGVGGRLLDRLLRWAGEARPRATLRLSVNPAQTAAVQLYRARGFAETGVTEPLPHTPTVRMVELARVPRRKPPTRRPRKRSRP